MISNDQYRQVKEKSKKRRAKWPFALMEAGEIIQIKQEDVNKPIERLQSYVHAYGRKYGKKFETVKFSGTLYVKRLS